jgi:hypothetical protein
MATKKHSARAENSVGGGNKPTHPKTYFFPASTMPGKVTELSGAALVARTDSKTRASIYIPSGRYSVQATVGSADNQTLLATNLLHSYV